MILIKARFGHLAFQQPDRILDQSIKPPGFKKLGIEALSKQS